MGLFWQTFCSSSSPLGGTPGLHWLGYTGLNVQQVAPSFAASRISSRLWQLAPRFLGKPVQPFFPSFRKTGRGRWIPSG